MLGAQRVASQLAQTDALLNKYIRILSKAEKYSHLIFDEQWYGAEEVSFPGSVFII